MSELKPRAEEAEQTKCFAGQSLLSASGPISCCSRCSWGPECVAVFVVLPLSRFRDNVAGCFVFPDEGRLL